MTIIVFCSSIEYVTITISIIIRHNNYELIKHTFIATAHLHRMLSLCSSCYNSIHVSLG